MSKQMTRREALGLGLASGAILAAGNTSLAQTAAHATQSNGIVVTRIPDVVIAYQGLRSPSQLERQGSRFSDANFNVEIEERSGESTIYLSAPKAAPTHIMLRWKQPVSPLLLLLGDAWERSYGELQWLQPTPDKPLPWYFLTWNGKTLDGCGVKTGAAALCFWQVDQDGVSLWLDVRNGGNGIRLGDRRLVAAQVVARSGLPGETPLASARAFCKTMASRPARPCRAVYGSNDWYYAYGKNSASATLRDAELIVSCAPVGAPAPFAIIDAGWERKEAFPDMAMLSDEIRRRDALPGIWVRPLEAKQEALISLLLPDERYGTRKERYAERAYDPTIPEALEKAISKVRQVVAWKYDLVKHDFSTYDLLGGWGFEMGASPTNPGWNFHNQSKTNAEIISDLYGAIRGAAGEKTLIIGCNTVGHLAAGIFEIQRTGDDVSGIEFRRTRRMGVNTLAYRLCQNGTFFCQDADCVPITTRVSWPQNRKWMELVAASGTACLISPAPDAVGEEQKRAIRTAFQRACHASAEFAPADWFETTTPANWEMTAGEKEHFDWYDEESGWPFQL